MNGNVKGGPFGHMMGAFRNTLRGLVDTFRYEMAFRQEIALIAPHALLMYLLSLPFRQCLLLSVLLAVVWVTELMNTAVECVVDLASPDYHELAKRAKDAASAAVGVALLMYVGTWTVVLVRLFAWR